MSDAKLRDALEAALPILQDRAAGGRMLTTVQRAKDVVLICEAALREAAATTPVQPAASDEITGLIAELADFQAGCISSSYEYSLYERVLQVLAGRHTNPAAGGGK